MEPNRRAHRRYNMQLELRWRLISRKRTTETGVGRTIDVSRGGVLFESSRQPPVGVNVEVAIDWPARLDNGEPMQLIVLGRVVRVGPGRTAIQSQRFAFRSSGLTVSKSLTRGVANG